jgi:hypothetical protein
MCLHVYLHISCQPTFQMAVYKCINGGVTVFLHCPGFDAAEELATHDIPVDLYVSPRELVKVGGVSEDDIARLVQFFGEKLVRPHLSHFKDRCEANAVTPPRQTGVYLDFFLLLTVLRSLSEPGSPIVLDSPHRLPRQNGLPGFFICRCCPDGELRRALAKRTISGSVSVDSGSDSEGSDYIGTDDEEWTSEHERIMSQFDPISVNIENEELPIGLTRRRSEAFFHFISI